jgi:hypothetical protein
VLVVVLRKRVPWDLVQILVWYIRLSNGDTFLRFRRFLRVLAFIAYIAVWFFNKSANQNHCEGYITGYR